MIKKDKSDSFVFNGVRMHPIKPRQLLSDILSFNISTINYSRASVIKNILKEAYSLVGNYSRWWRGHENRGLRVACSKFPMQEKKFLMSLKKYNVKEKDCRRKLLERYYNEILAGEGLMVYGRDSFIDRPKIKKLKDTGPYWRKKKKRKRLIF